VRVPGSGAQASALLLSAFLGLAVIVAEFLDNGGGVVGGATALDDVVDESEIVEATGITTGVAAALQFSPAAAPPYFQVVSGNTPYTLICVDVTVPLCDNDPVGTVQVFDDADGSGRLDTGALPAPSLDQATVIANLASADPVSLVVHMTDLQFPVAIDPDKTGALENFLGAGVPAGNFAFGVTGYLDLITTATDTLASGGFPEIDDQINAVQSQIDNGGDCLAVTDPAGAALFDLMFAIYSAAPGTLADPAVGQTNFGLNSHTSGAALTAGGTSFPVGINPANFIFEVPIGFKFLYPLSSLGGGFDLSNATPRIDATLQAFSDQFEFIPKLAPAAATDGDGQISIVEVMCAAG
ncbi:MAG: hypothetical protein O7G32_14300, partial [SAR324 cluster bacterium]|nr:hypothetical protein [SAR324 cluster bacterium]